MSAHRCNGESQPPAKDTSEVRTRAIPPESRPRSSSVVPPSPGDAKPPAVGDQLFGFHLRHSHVWLPYKGIWGKLFVSPAHHQLHHSVAVRHWDKNLGFVFAFWDWIFGTLYAVDKREKITFGMNGHEEPEYHSVRAMYLLPFVKAWRLLRRKAEAAEPAGDPAGLPHLPPAE